MGTDAWDLNADCVGVGIEFDEDAEGHLMRAVVLRAIRPGLDVQRIGLGIVAGLDHRLAPCPDAP